MNSTTAPKAIEPDDVVVARADERLVHAYDQIARADEQLARLNEQLAKLEQEAKHQPSAVVGHRPSRGRRALRGFIGLLLAACIFGFAFVSQSSYGEAAKSTVARWAPQLMASSLPDGKTGGARAAGPIWRSAGRGDAGASAINSFGADDPGGRRADSRPDSRPSWRSCSRRWRAISQTWSRGSCSSRRTRNKPPATMPRPPRSSRRARSK